MLKKKLLPLITELVVILIIYLGVIHLWRSQKMVNYVIPNPLHLQKWTIDILFKNKKIWKYVTKFKDLPSRPHPLPPFPAPQTHLHALLPCGHHKCVFFEVFTVIWFFFCLEKITTLLFERNKPIVKILLKYTSKPQNCGS